MDRKRTSNIYCVKIPKLLAVAYKHKEFFSSLKAPFSRACQCFGHGAMWESHGKLIRRSMLNLILPCNHPYMYAPASWCLNTFLSWMGWISSILKNKWIVYIIHCFVINLSTIAMNEEEVWVGVTAFFSGAAFLCVLALLCFFTCRLASRVVPLGTTLRFWTWTG